MTFAGSRDVKKPPTAIAGWGLSSTGTPLDDDLRDLCGHIEDEIARARDTLSKAGLPPHLDHLLDRFEEIRSWAEAAIEELELRGALASGPGGS